MAFGCPQPAPAAQPIRVVATGGRMGVGSFTTNATATAFWQRTPHKLGGPVSEIDAGFMNWVHSTTAEVANNTAATIEDAWIERAATGQVIALTFSGSRQLVMPASDPAAFHLADPVPSSAWTGSPPVRDEVFWVQAKGHVTSNGTIPQGTPSTYPGARFLVYDPSNDPGTKDFSGTVPGIAGQNSRTSALPMLFLGRYSGPGHLAVIGIGDSILHGMGDSENPVPAISGFGFFNRAAIDSNGSNTIAMMNLTRSGEASSAWVNNHARQAQLLPFANVVVEEFGTNDIGASGASANAETIRGRLDSIWTVVRAAGVQRIVRTRLMPRTTSASSNWTSLADQTPNPGWGAGGARDQLNAKLAADLSAGKIDALADTLTPVADPADDHCWLTNGSSDYATADGTHPKPAAYAMLAPVLRATLLALKVDDYQSWSARISWNGTDSTASADPDSDGVPNIMAYALRLAPLSAGSSNQLPTAEFDASKPGGPWLGLIFRKNLMAADLTYTVRTSTDLATWTDVTADGTGAVEETVDPDPDGDGAVVLQRFRVRQPAGEAARFLSLRISR